MGIDAIFAHACFLLQFISLIKDVLHPLPSHPYHLPPSTYPRRPYLSLVPSRKVLASLPLSPRQTHPTPRIPSTTPLIPITIVFLFLCILLSLLPRLPRLSRLSLNNNLHPTLQYRILLAAPLSTQLYVSASVSLAPRTRETALAAEICELEEEKAEQDEDYDAGGYYTGFCAGAEGGFGV